MKSQDLYRNFFNVVKNVCVYSNVMRNYYVGFPSDTKDDVKDDPITPMVTVNTLCFDHKTIGTVGFLEPKWIEVNCKKPYISSLKQNTNRALPIP